MLSYQDFNLLFLSTVVGNQWTTFIWSNQWRIQNPWGGNRD